MGSIQATRLKRGMLIKLENDLFRVLDLQHFTPGNKRGFVQAKMRNIRTGVQGDNKFRAEEDV
jgi:elongation factor P